MDSLPSPQTGVHHLRQIRRLLVSELVKRVKKGKDDGSTLGNRTPTVEYDPLPTPTLSSDPLSFVFSPSFSVFSWVPDPRLRCLDPHDEVPDTKTRLMNRTRGVDFPPWGSEGSLRRQFLFTLLYTRTV